MTAGVARAARARLHPRALAGRFLWRSGLCRHFEIATSLYRLRFFPTALSCALWTDPRARKGDEDFYRGYLRRDDTVVDVGANVGSLALAAASLVGPRGTVFAIEPHPRTHQYLLANVARNERSNVRVLHAAAGECRGTVSLSDDRLDDQNRVDEGGRIAVRAERLDDLVPARSPQLLKIDVEGYELFVLRGAPLLLRGTDCVYFECAAGAYRRYGYEVRDVQELLADAGFAIFERQGRELTPFLRPRGDHQNLVAVRPGTAGARRLGLA